MPLSTKLRNQLASVIKDARREGEAGAMLSLRGLAVDRHEPHGSMSLDERALRNRLRAHGRQLGDTRDRGRGTQEITRLAHEVAYEHWHRMLFARFLAENNLLVEPESGVAISMLECEDLAREQGEDPWALAGRYAQRMLPRIFRPNDPALAVPMAPETRQALERLLESLPAEVFTSDDALGWTYQFWQAERKDEVNASGVKIGADELPAVTQLFTEHYMVLFLFHNTIGAWHAGKILAEQPELATVATSEEELRRAVRLRAAGGYDFSYLRFVREANEGDEDGTPTGPWRPAASAFEGWPRTAAELTVLDPCCGSGHFLVEGLELLVRLRMEEEGLVLDDAIRAVLAENLHGLEIDPRCTQIAAFNLALAAWRVAGRTIELPPLNIACSGLAPNATKEQWLGLAERAAAAGGMPANRELFETNDTLLSARVREGLSALYEVFEQAPELGSLIDPRALEGDLLRADFAGVQPLLDAAITGEREDAEGTERAVAAQGMARAAELLADEYTLVITNVPYLGRGAQSDSVRSFAEASHPEGKNDLATIFLSRIFRWLGGDGTSATVLPQNWLYLSGFGALRKKVLRDRTLNLIAPLGPGAFETIGGAVVNVALNVVSSANPSPRSVFGGFDVTGFQSSHGKAAALSGHPRDASSGLQDEAPIHVVGQSALRAGAHVIRLANLDEPDRVGSRARAWQGLVTGDDNRFLVNFWEVSSRDPMWAAIQRPPQKTSFYAGREMLVRWQQGHGSLHHDSKAHNFPPSSVLGHSGVAIQRMSKLSATLYTGEIFNDAVAPLVPTHSNELPAIWMFAASLAFSNAVRAVNQKVNVTPGSFGEVYFDFGKWQQAAAEAYPSGLPEPQTNDPRQWLFHGHPLGMLVNGTSVRAPIEVVDPVGTDRHPSLVCRTANPGAVLQVAVARLVGYRWPAEADSPMRLDLACRAWADDCRKLEPFADRDGIVCLNPARGEPGAGDRLRRMLVAAFGAAWSPSTERDLLRAASGDAQPAASIEEWVQDRFFEEHCKAFQHRPFVWHVWDGRRDGFHALVNYHRLAAPGGEGRRTLEALTYSYLGDWIQRQQAERRDGKEGADGRLAAALDLQAQLQRILAGEPPYDLFARWKPLHEQPIGWEPDINDGVRLNIRPFMNAELRTGGRKGAGILRWKPNVIWKKDRGTERAGLRPRDDFPWFWGCPGEASADERTDFAGGAAFDGSRWNDLHYTNAAKQAARERLPRRVSG